MFKKLMVTFIMFVFAGVVGISPASAGTPLVDQRLPQQYGANCIGHAAIFFRNTDGEWRNVANAVRALEFIDGTIVRSQEEFSFNDTVGERTPEKGFILGYNSAEQLVYGGGVCRASTVLYDAVLNAGMEILERHPHYPAVGYVPQGRDAMVDYGSADMRFLNPKPYPVVIKTKSTKYQDGTLIEAWIFRY